MLDTMKEHVKDETFKKKTLHDLQGWIQEGWNQGEKREVDEHTLAIATLAQRLKRY